MKTVLGILLTIFSATIAIFYFGQRQYHDNCVGLQPYHDFKFYILKETGNDRDYNNPSSALVMWSNNGKMVNPIDVSSRNPQLFDDDPIIAIKNMLVSAKITREISPRLWNNMSITYFSGKEKCIVSLPFDRKYINQIQSMDYDKYKNQEHRIYVNGRMYLVHGDPNRIFYIPLSLTGYIGSLIYD